MNVLVLHSELGVLLGGGETFTRNLFTAFVARGHRVAVAFRADPHGRYPMSLPSCFDPIPIPGIWSRKPGQATLSTIGRCFPTDSWLRGKWDHLQEAICWRTIRWHSRRFQRRIEQEFALRWSNFDAVYVQSIVPLAQTAARHRPTVLMLPGPVSAELAPMLRAIHAVCAHDDGLTRMRAVLGDKILELPLGLDTQLFSPGETSVRRALGWSDQHRVIGYAGRFTQLKGIDLLAAAFRQVSQTIPSLRLLLVGDGEEERNIRSLLEKELTAGIVHIEPALDQNQLPGWYRAMDLLVMPSRYETMSNAILEAMACGVPFLASKVGGNKTLGVTNTGWLFESESVCSLITHLQRVITDRAALKARGAFARDYVQQRYSWAASAERLESILNRIWN